MTMTAQEILTKSATHLLQQGAVSRTGLMPGNICAYRGSNGTACSVGCLIPDGLYDPEMENKRVPDLMRHPGISDLLGEANIELLEALQLVHDQKAVATWETELRSVATRFGLEFPDVEK